MIIEGIPRSLNELSYAEVSSSEKQKDGDILEEPQAIKDFTVKTNLDARNVARSILKANSIMEGNKSSNGHPQSWDLRPGMVIEYEGVKEF